jgi:hypothetical protein
MRPPPEKHLIKKSESLSRYCFCRGSIHYDSTFFGNWIRWIFLNRFCYVLMENGDGHRKRRNTSHRILLRKPCLLWWSSENILMDLASRMIHLSFLFLSFKTFHLFLTDTIISSKKLLRLRLESFYRKTTSLSVLSTCFFSEMSPYSSPH